MGGCPYAEGALMRLSREEWRGGRHANEREVLATDGGKSTGRLRLGDDAHARACEIDEGPRDDGVRHPGRRACRHRDPGNHAFQAQAAGTVDCHSRWNKRTIGLSCDDDCAFGSRGLKARARLAEKRGQSTVEFAIVMAGFLSLTVALAAMWRFLGSGAIVDHVLAVASHHIQTVAPVTITDIFLY